MTAYLEVAQELVASGYLNAADLHAAAAMLVEKMRIAVAKYQEAVATDDLVDQQNVIAEAEAEIEHEVKAEAEVESVEQARFEDAVEFEEADPETHAEIEPDEYEDVPHEGHDEEVYAEEDADEDEAEQRTSLAQRFAARRSKREKGGSLTSRLRGVVAKAPETRA